MKKIMISFALKFKTLFFHEKQQFILLLKNVEGFFLSKTKFNIVLDIIVFTSFSIVIFSIPTFSSSSVLYLVTWILTIVLLVSMALSLLLFYKVQIDFICICIILFVIFAFLSSAFMGFKNFAYTPLLMSFISLNTYMYAKSNKQSRKILIYCAEIGVLFFALVFAVYYREKLFTLEFERLGGIFGDENDVSLVISFGFAFSLWSILFSNSYIIKLFHFIFLLVLALFGLSTGSKIFIFNVIFVFVSAVLLKNGLKKWWLSAIVLTSMVCFIFIIFSLNEFNFYKDRLVEMFNVLSGTNETYGSTGSRLEMIFMALNMFLKKPLFGYGINGYANYGEYNYGWSHNQLAESLCNFGLIGTVLWHYGFVKSIIGFLKKLRTNKVNSYDIASFIIIVLFFTAMISIPQITQKFYAYIIGIVMATITNETDIVSLKSPIAKNKGVEERIT